MVERQYALPEARDALKLSSPQRNQIYYHAKKLGMELAPGRKQARFTEEQILQIAASMRSSPKSILKTPDEAETLLELRGRDLVNSTDEHYAKANKLLDEILERPRAIMPLYRSLRDVFPEKKS